MRINHITHHSHTEELTVNNYEVLTTKSPSPCSVEYNLTVVCIGVNHQPQIEVNKNTLRFDANLILLNLTMNVVAYHFPLCDKFPGWHLNTVLLLKNTQWELTRGRENSCLVIYEGKKKKMTNPV